MADFVFDLRGLPSGFVGESYKNIVKDKLVNNLGVASNDDVTFNAVVGILLIGEYFDSSSPSFYGAIRTAREELLNEVRCVPFSSTLEGLSSVEIVALITNKYVGSEIKTALLAFDTNKTTQALVDVKKSVIRDILEKLPVQDLKTIVNRDPTIKTYLDNNPVASKNDILGKFDDIKDAESNTMLRAVNTAGDIKLLIPNSKMESLKAALEKMSGVDLKALAGKFTQSGSNAVSSREVFEKISDYIDSTRENVFFQEFASVGRYVIARADEVPFGHPRFETQIEIALNQYVSGAPVFDSLDLPPLTGDNNSDTEIVADNIKAVSMIYATYQLDVGMRMIDVVDRINEIFHNGQLPIGFDAGGKAIDEYNWSAEDRMNGLARRSHYQRVLGAHGGVASKEVQPNTQFETLFIRFLSSLAEYDRQQRVADIVASARPRNLTSEYVRKAGRDLAANLSLYGWAATQFAARRLRQHIESSLNILKQPSIQKAYGVTNLYQVIERVAASEFNATPNIVKHRTMAEAGKQILDIVAKYSNVWNKSDGTPLFSENLFPLNNQGVGLNRIGIQNGNGADISDEDKSTLLVQTQYWLAVNGVKDAQVDQYAEPEISKYAPSIPSFGNFGSSGSLPTGTGNTDQMEKIKQMVTSGQMPSLDQLQGMFTGGKMGV